MNDALLVVILVLGIFERDEDRAGACFVYAVFCGFHSVLMTNLEGFVYYWSAGLFDLFIVYALCMMVKQTKLNNALVDISLLSIALNAYGWFLYKYNFLADTYNLCYTALYVLAILSILRKERAHDYKISKRSNGIRLALCKCRNLCRSFPKETSR